jgi:methylenetetrahydrofolate dehydrogenase (NADP+) / methenyltetrahydrofolate cyclohydrolase
MTAIMFDGRQYARRLLQQLKVVGQPVLVSLYSFSDPGSRLYTKLKKQAAESIGVEFVDYDIDGKTYDEVSTLIVQANRNPEVRGILVQLPLPEHLASSTTQIIELIDPKKDVDGMRENSMFVTPVAKAVGYIIGESPKAQLRQSRIVVVGAGGFEGSRIVKHLKNLGFNDIVDCDTQNADVVISVVGSPELIGADDIKSGSVVIDVGAPRGDVKMEVKDKAAFFSAVPGGVGPVTISCLLENLLLK